MDKIPFIIVGHRFVSNYVPGRSNIVVDGNSYALSLRDNIKIAPKQILKRTDNFIVEFDSYLSNSSTNWNAPFLIEKDINCNLQGSYLSLGFSFFGSTVASNIYNVFNGQLRHWKISVIDEVFRLEITDSDNNKLFEYEKSSNQWKTISYIVLGDFGDRSSITGTVKNITLNGYIPDQYVEYEDIKPTDFSVVRLGLNRYKFLFNGGFQNDEASSIVLESSANIIRVTETDNFSNIIDLIGQPLSPMNVRLTDILGYTTVSKDISLQYDEISHIELTLTRSYNTLTANATVDPKLEDQTVSYLWSNGATTQSINIIEVGTYSCTVTDSIGQTATASIVVEDIQSKYPLYKVHKLPTPLQNGYTHNIKPVVLRTEMTDGSIRQRLLNPSAPNNITCTIQLDSEQLARFKKFYENELDYGAEWFVMPIMNLDSDDISNKLVRIQNGELSIKLLHRNQITALYQIQLKLDVDQTIEV